jgi:HK97 family phage portal protein
MGLLDLFLPARGGRGADVETTRVEPPLVSAGDVQSESQWKTFAVPDVSSRAGVKVNETSALSIPATLAALRILTGVFAMTPVHYYERGERGRRNMDSLPEAQLFRANPNSHQTPFSFMELALADLLLAGDFYGYVSRNARGEPTVLTRLKPGTVSVSEYFDREVGTVLFYDATLPDGMSGRFASREIMHVPGFSRNGIHGLSPIKYAREALGASIATSNHAANFWSKGGRPSTVLQTKAKVSTEDKGRIRSDWTNLYSGSDGDRVAVLDQDLSAQFLSHDMKSSQFLETREFQVVDLARIWGVPPHLIFDLGKATFSNIEQQSLEFVIYHMGPHYMRFSEKLTKLFARPGHYFEHMTDALVKGDIKSRMEAYWLQRQMGMSNANELRAKENQPDIDGDAGSEYWRPSNMAVAGQPGTITGDAE